MVNIKTLSVIFGLAIGSAIVAQSCKDTIVDPADIDPTTGEERNSVTKFTGKVVENTVDSVANGIEKGVQSLDKHTGKVFNKNGRQLNSQEKAELYEKCIKDTTFLMANPTGCSKNNLE